MINKLKNRLASEQGFTLIELLVVIIILGILVAIAVPAYLSFTSKAHAAAAVSNVRSAVPAAEGWYQDAIPASSKTADNYLAISAANLAVEAPGISGNTAAVSLNSGKGYCIDDTEPDGSNAYYIGGDPGTVTGTVAAVTAGSDCLTAAGTASG